MPPCWRSDVLKSVTVIRRTLRSHFLFQEQEERPTLVFVTCDMSTSWGHPCSSSSGSRQTDWKWAKSMQRWLFRYRQNRPSVISACNCHVSLEGWICDDVIWGNTVAWWAALLPHSKEVPGLSPGPRSKTPFLGAAQMFFQGFSPDASASSHSPNNTVRDCTSVLAVRVSERCVRVLFDGLTSSPGCFPYPPQAPPLR